MSKRVRTLLVALVLASVVVAVVCLLLPLACAPRGPNRVGGRAAVVDADWPTWRYDASRRAASPLELPERLHLQWVRQYPPLKPAWKDPINQDRMGYDRFYEPVVAGQTMFVGFNASDKVVALDTRTGAERWRFYCDGPVRLPPTAWGDKVYFVSDDGFLYCLDAADGSLRWKFRGGPDGRKVLGNERLISAWPARGGPVVADGTIYFGASIWPFMGSFIHALDAETGKVVWTNDGSGSTYMLQPHNSPAFAGPAPQGCLAVIGEKLLVPNGRSTPACLDRRTGKMLYYRLADHPKTGGSHVSASGKFLFNYRTLGADMYDLATGNGRIPYVGKIPVLTDRAFYFSGNPVVALDSGSLRRIDYKVRQWDSRTRKYVMVPKVRWKLSRLWECPADASASLIKAGRRLYAGGKGVISAIEIPAPAAEPKVVWKMPVDGTVCRLLAADRRLFAITAEGKIHCFAGDKAKLITHPATEASPGKDDDFTARAKGILARTGVTEGYCLAYGVGSGRLVEELARNSKLRIVAVVGSEDKVRSLRLKLDSAGLYGERVAVHAADPLGFAAPPYIASLTVVEDPPAAGIAEGERFIRKLFHSMRPYGGVAWIKAAPAEGKALAAAVKRASLPGARLELGDGAAMLFRDGPLPGAGSWTHQYGNVANTVLSTDTLVKVPLGLLWFGGSSHMDVLPRHGHGPPEQVIGGRLFIQGIDCLSARDVYTGRVLWKRELPDLATFGVYYDRTYKPKPLDTSYNQVHIPGANARGTNFVATGDAVYVLQSRSCLKLDPASGATISEFKLPAEKGATGRPRWGYVGVCEDLLIAGAGFVTFPKNLDLSPGMTEEDKKKNRAFLDFDTTSSRKLVVMDRHSGKVAWTFAGRLGLRHSAIAAGGGKLFCIDAVPPLIASAMRRRGTDPPAKARLLAFDVRTGRGAWESDEGVFGTWLSYSAEHDIVLQSGRPSRDMLYGEPGSRMSVHAAKDGREVWRESFRYSGPPIIRGRTIITQGAARDLLTGAEKLRPHPLTGKPMPWRYTRNYGCNTVIASSNLLTFRSAAAGYYDLTADAGTGNIGGFKSGCTSNLVVADGVLNAPDYTRTCTCSYQNQTSLALVHSPDVETWTFQSFRDAEGRIERVGINLGAPGDRLGPGGTLWLDYPSVGGTSPDLPVDVGEQAPTWFRRHSSRVSAGPLRWAAASGAEGLRSMTICLNVRTVKKQVRRDGRRRTTVRIVKAREPAEPRLYTVRLCFAEPAEKAPGERVFDVSIEGRRVLKDFDVVKAAGGPGRSVVKEFRSVRLGEALKLELAPSPSAPKCKPLLCGVEIVAEKQ